LAVSYLKKGAQAAKEVSKAETQAELNKSKVYRFWLPKDSDARITFLDGDLLPNGLIDGTVYHEHDVKINGKFGNPFVCIKEYEVCPLCEQGDNSSFVAAFTIIDHRSYEDREGKTVKDTLRLFVCKLDTYKMLQKIATKRGGLAGCTFDVTRTGDKSANVGNMFDFVEKKQVAALLKKYKVEVVDYEKAIPYRDEESLRALGFGSDNSAQYGSKYKGKATEEEEEEEEEVEEEEMEEDL
jgi:hypothetical protein